MGSGGNWYVDKDYSCVCHVIHLSLAVIHQQKVFFFIFKILLVINQEQ